MPPPINWGHGGMTVILFVCGPTPIPLRWRGGRRQTVGVVSLERGARAQAPQGVVGASSLGASESPLAIASTEPPNDPTLEIRQQADPRGMRPKKKPPLIKEWLLKTGNFTVFYSAFDPILPCDTTFPIAALLS